MRPIYAWILLLSTCVQWAAGSYYLKSVYAVEARYAMNATERAIGRAVAQELGLDVTVRLLSEAEVNQRAIGYNGFFAFPREIDGRQVYYTLESDSLAEVEYTYRLDELPNPDAPDRSPRNWQRLFPQFHARIDRFALAPTMPPAHPARNFADRTWRERSAPAPLGPPPRWIA